MTAVPVATPVAAPVPPPAAEPVGRPTPAVNGTAGPDHAGVERVLLDVVAEKTGYPVGMLDLGMALDADLGVDSIKRVEILSALQEKLPDAPTVKPEHLGTLHTLRDVAAFLAAVVPAGPVHVNGLPAKNKPAPPPVSAPPAAGTGDGGRSTST